MFKVDRCVMCGAYVPEGRMVCLECEEESKEALYRFRSTRRERNLEYKQYKHKTKPRKERDDEIYER